MSCDCHGTTFCPDEICIGYEDDVPVYVRRDSPEGLAVTPPHPALEGELFEHPGEIRGNEERKNAELIRRIAKKPPTSSPPYPPNWKRHGRRWRKQRRKSSGSAEGPACIQSSGLYDPRPRRR
jgi:hypothetical protein